MSNQGKMILLAEDDPGIAEPLIFGLAQEGFQVSHVTSGPEALKAVQAEEPDAVLLDVMLPGMDGFAVCKAIRQGSTVPILMLTARGQELDKVMGLELGADDYIVKPFSFRELLARVRAALRRRELDHQALAPQPEPIAIGEIVLDTNSRQVSRRGRAIELTSREFDLLRVLMEHCGQAIARQELIDRVWGEEWIGDPHTLDVHIRWLREKLERDPSHPRYLQTLRGFGYRFLDADAQNTRSS